MKKEKMKYWSEHPIISGIAVAVVTLLLENCVGEPIIDHYFPVDTVSTFVDNYLVDTGYVDASVLEVESLDQKFQIIYESFAEYDEAVQDALVRMGKNQEEVSKMERSVLLSKLPDVAKDLADKCADKDVQIDQRNGRITALETENADLKKQVDDYKQRKEAEVLDTCLIIDGELLNNGDAIKNAVVKVDGNHYYSESLLNTHILGEKIQHNTQEKAVIVGNAKPEKVKFSWELVTNSSGVDLYEMGGGESFAMDTTNYSEGLVLTGNDYFYAFLGGNYSKMSFTYGHVDKTRIIDLKLTIWALGEDDDAYKELQTVQLRGDMPCSKVEIPLGYATKIKVVVSDGGGYDNNRYAEFGLTDIYFYS